MSLLRPSIVGRLLKAAGPAAYRPAPAFARYGTQTTVGTTLTESDESKPSQSSSSSVERTDTKIRHNNPDWNVEVDQASSYAQLAPISMVGGLTSCRTYSPVPKRVMDGSEEGEVLPAAVLSGAPIELQARTVRYGITTECAGYTADTIPASIAQPKQLHSREIGTNTTGEWIGISCQRATDGRIH